MSSSTKRSGRGGRGGGRGRGRRGGGGGRGNNRRGNRNSNAHIRDEDVLIEFMPYIRQQDPEAVKIHQNHANDSKAFVQAARIFLESKSKQASSATPTRGPKKNKPHLHEDESRTKKAPADENLARKMGSALDLNRQTEPAMTTTTTTAPSHMTTTAPSHTTTTPSSPLPPTQPPGFNMPRPPPTATTVQTSNQETNGTPQSNLPPGFGQPNQKEKPRSPPSQAMGSIPRVLSPSMPQIAPVDPTAPPKPAPQDAPTILPPQGIFSQQSSPHPPGGFSPVRSPPGGHWMPCAPGVKKEQEQTVASPKPPLEQPKPRKEYQPRRLWTRLDQQPGRVFANNVGAVGSSAAIALRPRQELTAKWILPLKYLRQRMTEKEQAQGATIQDALQSLTVGLFRRGCIENGANASIISKEVFSPPDESRADYPYEVDQRNDVVWGTVPFYAPRTPGKVLFRLYWQDEPLYTLATGPTMVVRVTDNDFEQTLRFILSNFKSKKGSATSLSSLNSLAVVIGQFRPGTGHKQQHYGQGSPWESAGRAAWGCICESRKVLEACAEEHLKTKEKLKTIEAEVEALKEQLEQEEGEAAPEEPSEDEKEEEQEPKTADRLKEKTHALMGGRAANERKWKDSQSAFASILKAVVFNGASSMLFRRELVSKIRLELELWCPLCESFATSPFNSDPSALCVSFNQFPQHVTGNHYHLCIDKRSAMQKDMLGFVPRREPLEHVLMSKKQPNVMDRVAVDAFNRLSTAMGQLYQDAYHVGDRIHQQRELVRSHLESIVGKCEAFPPGTRVIVFGSSANGFGSPASDLDMCLQLPPQSGLLNSEDKTGALAMAQLAELLEGAGMTNVDTARLTARIPIIKFNCARPMAAEGEDAEMECDLSMQNPLACVNTSLLLTYSRIHPVTRVLASIIKRWAKARDMNNPSQHTLSTYGYILMLLHFLTFHRRTGTGLVTPVTTPRSKNSVNDASTNMPLLPNLQWMDPGWLQTPLGTPYRELGCLPKHVMPHPLESRAVVNTYFHRVADQGALSALQPRFPSNDLSLSILLASFFGYYAHQFDYKRHVVSLHSTLGHGLTEREVKAEHHLWKVYSTNLAVEDPFETFYDVAHVLNGANFHRLRHELALAYTKIVEAALGIGEPKSGMELIDWICEPVKKEEDGDSGEN